MAVTMPLSWMKRVRRSKIDGGSLSNPTMKPPWTCKPGPLYRFHARHEVPVLVLELLAFGKARLVRGFNAHKNRIETRLDHKLHELPVVGKVDGDLRGKGKGVASLLHPVDEAGQHLPFQFCLVSDEVVVNEKDAPLPARPIEPVKLGDDLVPALRPGLLPVKDRNVAEFAVERAAP